MRRKAFKHFRKFQLFKGVGIGGPGYYGGGPDYYGGSPDYYGGGPGYYGPGPGFFGGRGRGV